MLFEKPKREVVIGNDPANVDGLNFLEGKSMAYINRKRLRAPCWHTMTAACRTL